MTSTVRRPETVPSAWRGRRSIVALFVANAISLTGSQFTVVAIPWFVLATTGSTSRTAMVAACETGALVLSFLVSGTLVDRLPYRETSVAADLASGAAVAIIAGLSFGDRLPFPVLLALVAVASACNVTGTTARLALLPDLVGEAGVRMQRATATMQAIQRAAILVGAPVAGLLILPVGARGVLWIDAASFAVSAAIIGGLIVHRRATPESGAGAKETGSFFAQAREGVRFIRSDRLLSAMILTTMAMNLLDATFVVFIPAMARQVYDSSVALGLMVGAAGGGGLASAVLFSMVGHRLPLRRTVLWSFCAIAFTRIPLAFFPPLPLALLSRAASGAAGGPISPLFSTVLFRRTPPEIRGRSLGVVGSGAQLATPLGAGLGGALIAAVGLRGAVIAVVAASCAVTLTLWRVKAFHEMDTVATN